MQESNSKYKAFRIKPTSGIGEISKQEARGVIIDCHNYLEAFLSQRIAEYFNPENVREFKSVMLHSEIISFGGKLKLARRFDLIFKKDEVAIARMNKIRNTFVHSPIWANFSSENHEDTIETMDFNGNISKKSAPELYDEFIKTYKSFVRRWH